VGNPLTAFASTSAYLIKDIVTTPASSNPVNFFSTTNGTVFFADVPGYGSELWKTDGTDGGTVLVKDINPGSSGSLSGTPVILNGVIYFSGNNGVNGAELWRSDGTTSGTYMVKDISTGYSASAPANFVAAGGVVYFAATNGTSGIELWKSDGTDGGTVMVKDIRSGSNASQPASLYNLDGVVYFSANDGTNGTELWKTDGTDGGTVMVKNIRAGSSASSPTGFINVGPTLYFRASNGTNGSELWKSDGTDGGTVMVKDINVGINPSTPSNFVVLGSVLFFSANDGVNSVELWKSDGTDGGTVMVKDIYAGVNDSLVSSLMVFGDRVYFSAYDGHGIDPWVSDGTSIGTVRLKDVLSIPYNDFGVTNLATTSSGLFFFAYSEMGGRELWKTDGTEVGTVVVKDINPGGAPSLITSAFAVGNTLYFGADDGVNGKELWKTDGTEGGTMMVKNISSGTASAGSFALERASGSKYFFTLSTTENGREIWFTDGAVNNVSLTKDLSPVDGLEDSSVTDTTTSPAVMNGNYYIWSFHSIEGDLLEQMTKTDGTESGTTLLKLINPIDSAKPNNNASAASMLAIGNTLYFAADDGTNQDELWKTDGTEGGTVMVKNIHPSGASFPGVFTALDDKLFFFADDGTNGRELWKSDGTDGGTVMVKNLNPSGSGTVLTFESKMVTMGSSVFFYGNNGSDSEIFKTDGTDEGTVMLKNVHPSGASLASDFTVVGNKLFFTANSSTTNASERALWVSDGTDLGTQYLKELATTSPNFFGFVSPSNLTSASTTLFFEVTNHGIYGDELWVSDGTVEGTKVVKDIMPGNSSARLTSFAAVGSTVFFSAYDETNGQELWKSDGTEGGTYVYDIYPGTVGSNPLNIRLANSRLIMSANISGYGVEPVALVLKQEADFSQPVVTDITADSATVQTSITDVGYGRLRSRGIEYGKNGNYDTVLMSEGDYSLGSYSLALTGLSCGQQYSVRALGNNGYAQGVGQATTFTTSACAATTPVGNGSPSFIGASGLPGMVQNFIAPQQQPVTQVAQPQVSQQQASEQQVPSAVPAQSATMTFPRNLAIGNGGEDVRRLQVTLNALGFIVSDVGPGSPGNETQYYGERTAAALRRFQEAYREYILVPAGLVEGTGFFGPLTRRFFDEL
jgi:ELWxxDGT repeat protein